ncbi:endoplasmic reticulum-Golgi intermediate compartment protein 3-like isoform X1 [Mercenaria mercenaria]|uniref:endoplasmic reticulum-Golgi intermediate compartment protein 3-like isoform X1 n=2 Tax=Mercenaria mercenaria TaxID=6596 RepID=UPI00234EC3CE|nr:endoplasmic reticulum-Golgi intermediate compartment protein 3-like isoform X1 [Mercenaria mercenaria]
MIHLKLYLTFSVTIISGVLMFVLFISELNYYLTKEVQPELFVDISRGNIKMKINLNVTFHNMPCAFLSIDAMDVSGENQIDVDHNLFKQRLKLSGERVEDEPEKQDLGDKSEEIVEAVKQKLDPDRCESCYGAETEDKKCCNTCEEVRDQYRKKGWAFKESDAIEQCKREGWSDKIKAQQNEGCNVYGYIEVNKVGGNFHMAPGKSFQQHHVHVHDLQALGGAKYNTTHTIHHLSFGEEYPGKVNPLDGLVQVDDTTQMMFQYFIKIVPTTYTSVDGMTVATNQFSATKHSKVIGILGDSGLPGMFVTYELSPMMVKYTEKRRSFMHFLTGVCAIIGGIFTVAGLIDSMIYHSARALQKKIELGKAT